MTRPVRVLIVDDSRIFRCALERALAGGEVEVVGSVWSGPKALEVLRQAPVDLVLLDLQMPGMDGVATLEAIARHNAARPEAPPVGVLVVSAQARADDGLTQRALQAGALDFVAKPQGRSPDQAVELLRCLLLPRLRRLAARRVCLPPPAPPGGARPARAVLIGVSTGGPESLMTLLPPLCAPIEAPVFVVQHIGPEFTGSLAGYLGTRCCRSHAVVEARDGEAVRPRTVYIAPGGRHLVVRCGPEGGPVTGLTEGPPENGFRPSADVLFRSAAAVYGGDVVALVLTGMGADGVAGLGPVKRAGGYVIAQDEATSVVWGMPGKAVASGHVDEVLPLPAIAAAVHARMGVAKEAP